MKKNEIGRILGIDDLLENENQSAFLIIIKSADIDIVITINLAR